MTVNLAQQMYDLSRINLWLSTFSFLPKISVFYGYNTSIDSFIFDFEYWGDNATKNYGVNITFPIFELRKLIFKYFSAKKDARISQFSKQKTILDSEKALHVSYFGLKESIDKLKFAGKGLEVAEEAIALAREQYGLGVISILELLRIEEEYYNARVNLIKVLSEFYVNQATLSFLLGKTTIEE